MLIFSVKIINSYKKFSNKNKNNVLVIKRDKLIISIIIILLELINNYNERHNNKWNLIIISKLDIKLKKPK